MKDITKEMGRAEKLKEDCLSVIQMDKGEGLEIFKYTLLVAQEPITILARFKDGDSQKTCQEVIQVVCGHDVWQGRARYRADYQEKCEALNEDVKVLKNGIMPIIPKDKFLIPANAKESAWFIIPREVYANM